MSLQYTMDNPAFFPEDDDERLIEEELKSLERTTGSSKTSLRTKQKQKQDIDIVDLFLQEEEEKQGRKEPQRSEKSTKKATRKRAENVKQDSYEDSRNDNVDSGMGSMPSRNGDEDEEIDGQNIGNDNEKNEHSIKKRLSGSDEDCPVPDVIKPMDKTIDDTVLNMDEYDAEDEDDRNKNVSDGKLKVRTVHVLPAHNEEAAILSTILVGMSIEAQYPPQLYSKIFRSYRMAKILGKMSKEEKNLILKMVEDF